LAFIGDFDHFAAHRAFDFSERSGIRGQSLAQHFLDATNGFGRFSTLNCVVHFSFDWR